MCSRGGGKSTPIQLNMGDGPEWVIHSCDRCDPNKKNKLTWLQRRENKKNGFK